jgi:hypothetical protein
MPVMQRAQRVTSTWNVSRSSSAHGHGQSNKENELR